MLFRSEILLLAHDKIKKHETKIINQRFYKKNKDRIDAIHKKYRQDNPEKVAAARKEYRIRNKEQISQQKKEYYQRKKAKQLAAITDNKNSLNCLIPSV